MTITESHAAGLLVRECGEGFPLLLLHPGPGLDGSVFFPGADRLAGRGIRVLALDLPGNGGSDPAAESTFSGTVRAITAAADALGLDRYGLLGHSFGGFVTMQHAVDAPERLACLVGSCTDASETPDWPEPDPVEQLPPDVGAAVRAGLELEDEATTPEQLRDAWLAQAPLFAAEPTGAAVERVRERLGGCRFRADTLHNDWGELEALDALTRLPVPVLAIHGEGDIPVPPAAGRRIAERAMHGTYVGLAGGGHFPFLDDEARYWDAVGDWLADNAPAN